MKNVFNFLKNPWGKIIPHLISAAAIIISIVAIFISIQTYELESPNIQYDSNGGLKIEQDEQDRSILAPSFSYTPKFSISEKKNYLENLEIKMIWLDGNFNPLPKENLIEDLKSGCKLNLANQFWSKNQIFVTSRSILISDKKQYSKYFVYYKFSYRTPESLIYQDHIQNYYFQVNEVKSTKSSTAKNIQQNQVTKEDKQKIDQKVKDVNLDNC